MSDYETKTAYDETETTSGGLRVLHVPPGKRAEMIEIEDSLKAMQELVGGMIEEYCPFEDDVAIVCNDEGKMMGLPLNRGIRNEEGQLQDIIAGDFFVCYAPIESENFLSLPPELETKYKEMFDFPEEFFRTDHGIESAKYKPVPQEKEASLAR